MKPTKDMIEVGDSELALVEREEGTVRSRAEVVLTAALETYELGFELDAAEKLALKVASGIAERGESVGANTSTVLIWALGRAQRTLTRLVLPPAEPQPDAPTDIAALPDYWDERRRRQHKPDKSRCAAELRIALAKQPALAGAEWTLEDERLVSAWNRHNEGRTSAEDMLSALNEVVPRVKSVPPSLTDLQVREIADAVGLGFGQIRYVLREAIEKALGGDGQEVAPSADPNAEWTVDDARVIWERRITIAYHRSERPKYATEAELLHAALVECFPKRPAPLSSDPASYSDAQVEAGMQVLCGSAFYAATDVKRFRAALAAASVPVQDDFDRDCLEAAKRNGRTLSDRIRDLEAKLSNELAVRDQNVRLDRELLEANARIRELEAQVKQDDDWVAKSGKVLVPQLSEHQRACAVYLRGCLARRGIEDEFDGHLNDLLDAVEERFPAVQSSERDETVDEILAEMAPLLREGKSRPDWPGRILGALKREREGANHG